MRSHAAATAILEPATSTDVMPVCLCPWQENPYRLVSLWDIMDKFTAANCCGLFTALGQIAQNASLMNPGEVIDKGTLGLVWKQILFPAGYMAGELNLKASAGMVMDLQQDFRETPVSASELQWKLAALGNELEREM